MFLGIMDPDSMNPDPDPVVQIRIRIQGFDDKKIEEKK
jgi:hypothetical protein